MATDYDGLIASARAEARDLVNSNPITRETPVGDVDGTNTVFYLANKNIVDGTVGGVNYGPFYTYGSTKRAATGFTLDALNGLFTTTAAPVTTTQPRFVDYFFQWFTDDEYTSWIDQATEELGQTAGEFSGAVAGGGNLRPALIQYVIERFWTNRASQYANKYPTAAAGASEDIATVTENFMSLAKAARAKGNAMRQAAFVDPGSKKKAASGTISYGMSRGTPRT